MQSTRRTAMPLRVHQIWDAIGRASSSQVMDFEKLNDVVLSMHKVPRAEVNHELNLSIADGLVISEAVETQRREETEVYRLPDPETLEKNKGDHDWYCFECHLGGSIVKCEDCPRVYHLDCLAEDRKPDKDLFVCPACHIMSTKPSMDKMQGLKIKQLNQLIGYVCEGFEGWNPAYFLSADGATWAKTCSRTEKEAWRYDALVYLPMDIGVMQGKATDLKYQSLEEFQVDCETLAHAVGVYFGIEFLKGTQVGGNFLRNALHEIQEIKLCHYCFRRSNEKDSDWWFCLPCTPPHEVVFAKQAGYPYWPAKVMKRDGTKYDVRYFGGNYERGHIESKNIQKIDTPLEKLKVRRTQAWNEAYEELQKFQEIAKNPSMASSLPTARGKGSASTPGKKTGTKRGAASSSPEETVTKKSRKSEPATAVTTPARPPPKTTAGSAKAVMKSKESPKTNGTAKKKGTVNSKPSGTRRDSGAKSASGSLGKGNPNSTVDISADETLDPDLRNLLIEMEEDENVEGEVCFSDDDSSEPNDRVSEDAVSSSCTEAKSTRNAYVQVSRSGMKEINLERLSNYITQLKEQHKNEIDVNKKKQWCFNCGREAIYHCCWNTAYCSIECQQQHWTSEHKRLCRRVRRDRAGLTDQENY